eukprot:CAMPEP_0197000820 /NCGR_PEP_ID=MMETSP1380-20130617/5685_1 /TAXON_ID=5936 /ORGANISM="Euplotes crassus, Strain CT5" /LENGTH=158 /DNA_ID=CAMNT_0042418271 /DNA_START=644 /DNA_END=1120 /DNA_ORIENTATION=+
MLVEDVLDHAKIEAGVFLLNEEVFTMSECIGEIQELFTLQINGKGLQLNIEIQEKLKNLPILSDKQRIKQVIMNLISNCLKFTNRGSISIQVFEQLNQEELKIDEEYKNSQVSRYYEESKFNEEFIKDKKQISTGRDLILKFSELSNEENIDAQGKHD